jgi:hypothetical protein
MPELFEISAFAALLQSALLPVARAFSVILYPTQAGRYCFVNLDAFLADFTGHQALITKNSISAYGKELVIQLSDDWAIICHFALHGHAVTMSPSELEFTNLTRDNGLPPYTPLSLKSALDGTSIAIVDRNKLCRIIFHPLPEVDFPILNYHSDGRGFCPLKQTDEWEAGVLDLVGTTTTRRNWGAIAHFIYSR